MLDFFTHYLPTRIVGGEPGILGRIAPELEPFRGCRAGLVTDPVFAANPLKDPLYQSLKEAEIEVVAEFSGVPQDSDVEMVMEIGGLFREHGCNFLISMGGGSVMDTAKAVNIVLTHEGNLRDHQGAQALTEPLLPHLAIPTTVGTGSEVTKVSVIVDREDMRKLTFVDDRLAPTLAVLDPLLTYSLPLSVVASTAMDALTHALEAYVDVENSPFSDAWANAAASLIRENLPPALLPTGYEEARSSLQLASTMAGIAFNHSMVGVVHAMAHSLGGVAHVPHGLANALMLVEGLACNEDVAAERLLCIGQQSGFVKPSDTVQDFFDALSTFRNHVLSKAGLPENLHEAGVREEQIPLLVTRASEDGSMMYSPKYIDEQELERMFKSMMGANVHGKIQG